MKITCPPTLSYQARPTLVDRTDTGVWLDPETEKPVVSIRFRRAGDRAWVAIHGTENELLEVLSHIHTALNAAEEMAPKGDH